MRTDSSIAMAIHSIVLGLLFVVPTELMAQQSPLGPIPQGQAVLDSNGTRNPVEPSPLSQYVPNSLAIGQNASAQALFSRAQKKIYVSRNVDLRPAMTAYAAIKKCSLNEAFANTVSHLRLVPIQDQMTGKAIGALGYYKVVSGDTYQITADKKFFEQLPYNLKTIENGAQKVVIDIRFVCLPAEKLDGMRKFMIPGSFQVHNNQFPVAEPVATHALMKKPGTAPAETAASGTYVRASETRTKVYPTFMGRFQPAMFKKLMTQLQADQTTELILAPRVSVMAGVAASVSDAASRPFVVGVDRIEGDFTAAHKPIIQPIEDGTVVKLRATLEDGKIRLDGDLALSEVVSIDTFGYSDIKPGNADSVTVQIPEQKLKQVHWSTLIEEGNTIMLDPVFTRNVTRKLKKSFLGGPAKTVEDKKRLVVFLTPSKLDDEK